MQINSTRLKEPGLVAAGVAEKAGVDQGGQESPPTGSPVQTSGYSPSAELVHLTTAATQVPDVRPDVVRTVALRLSQGHYATPASADRTAEALLNAID